MASLMPSVPKTNVPYGSLPDPDILLSSDTFSDSSLWVIRQVDTQRYTKISYRSRANTRAIRPTARILFLITFRLSNPSSCWRAGDTTLSSSDSSSSSLLHVFSTATSISVTTCPLSTDTADKTSMTYFSPLRTVNSTWTHPWSWVTSMDEACSWTAECSSRCSRTLRQQLYCCTHRGSWGQRRSSWRMGNLCFSSSGTCDTFRFAT